MPVMRNTLIALSRNQSLQAAIAAMPWSRRMALRFVAGESLSQAVAAVLDLNERGLVATLDHLGENVASSEDATTAADQYVVALDALHLSGARSHISIKLTQMGLNLDQDLCYANISRILEKAAEYNNFVRIDMEDTPYTERTLTMYRQLRKTYDNVGIVVQSYLRRTRADVEALIAEGVGNFRLVKGAYDEPAALAFQDPAGVTRELQELTALCMSPSALARKTYTAIASHDSAIVNYGRAYAYRYDVPPSAYEFQMLYGIRRDLQAQLAKQGYTVRIYVPYGTHWYPYFMRRLAERPANLLFFLRALVGD